MGDIPHHSGIQKTTTALRRLRLLICLVIAGTTLTAQTVDNDVVLLQIVAQQSQQIHANDTVWQHYVSPLCLPLMFAPEPVRSLNDTTRDCSIYAVRSNARRYIATHHTDLYTAVSDPERMEDTEITPTHVRRSLVPDEMEDRLEKERAVRNRNSCWKKQANMSLQITQNYATENWYQGGVNSFAMLASVKAFANYKRGKFAWENTGEWRTGFSTVSGDTLRHVNTTDDVFRLFTKVGYQLHPKWYVSFSTEFRTNFWTTYKKNQKTFTTSFLTPVRLTLGIGVDYQPVKGLNINCSPIAYKMVYALHHNTALVDVTEFGIKEGEDIMNEFGSSVRLNWKWKPLREIEMETKFYFFTNYQKVETELELDFNFIINRYLSAKVMLHPRYDSSTEILTGRRSRIQFKEFISVGFAHTFY